ncbi:hypothetical protein GGP41_007179 [Bipolaris sorokiniana]|uniref:Uncharacterized protein n=1 Tax=Cochliobolus sativus TaxID=45130 RepID=A0A8H5ZU58_COCSA|nr:hypothetical protein GGP41_007179 [Bipolaris sorokiniana]
MTRLAEVKCTVSLAHPERGSNPRFPIPASSSHFYQYGMMLSLWVTVPLQATSASPIAACTMQSRRVMHSAA